MILAWPDGQAVAWHDRVLAPDVIPWMQPKAAWREGSGGSVQRCSLPQAASPRSA